MTPLKTVEVQTEYLDYYTSKQDQKLEMVFNRQKARAGANPEPPPITHPGKNISEIHTPRQTVFTQEQNALFIQQVLQ